MEMYLTDQKKKLRAGEPKKSPMPYLDEAKEIREIIAAFRGKDGGEAQAPTMPSDLKGGAVRDEGGQRSDHEERKGCHGNHQSLLVSSYLKKIMDFLKKKVFLRRGILSQEDASVEPIGLKLSEENNKSSQENLSRRVF